MVYVDDADSPTTETEDFESSDCEGSEAGEVEEETEKGEDCVCVCVHALPSASRALLETAIS